MGASTAILYSKINPTIAVMILDSPYLSLDSVIQEQRLQKIRFLPNFIFEWIYQKVKKVFLERYGFGVEDIRPIDAIKGCKVPSLFVCGDGDRIIRCENSVKLMEMHSGNDEDKKIIIIKDGTHNKFRPPEITSQIREFINKYLTKDENTARKY